MFVRKWRPQLGLWLAMAAVAIVACAGIFTGTAAGNSVAKQYRTHLGCGIDAKDGNCIFGNYWGASFEAKKRNARIKYRLCVNGPDGKWCDKKKTNRSGDDFVPLYGRYDTAGKYTATWKVGGKFAGRDTMRFLDIGD